MKALKLLPISASALPASPPRHRSHRDFPGTLALGFAVVCLPCATALADIYHLSDEELTGPVSLHQSTSGQVWGFPVLYSDPSADFLQEVSLFGRYQGQYWNLDSNRGDASDWDNRRPRIGARFNLLDNFQLSGAINIDPGFNPVYDSLQSLVLRWSPSDDFSLAVGKMTPRVTREFSVNSAEMLTFERSLLVDNVSPSSATGVRLTLKQDAWRADLHAFAGDRQDELTEFEGGALILLKIARDFDDVGPFRDADLYFDYLYNSSSEATAGTDFQHTFSLGGKVDHGAFSLTGDLIYAAGLPGEDDAFGLVILPSVFLIEDKLQFVARYHYAEASGRDGIRLRSRYEREAPLLSDNGRGESYHSAYAGLNYYINGHRLKLMAGVEYSIMNDTFGDGGDFSGWTWLTGIRMYF
ncbi:MAG: porin [Luteolibacter sp.]